MTTESTNIKNSYRAYLKNTLQAAEKKVGLLSRVNSFTMIPTDCLALNYLLNGGVTSGFYTISGFQRSGKTSLAVVIANSMNKYGGSLVNYFDCENALSFEKSKSLMGLPKETSAEEMEEALNYSMENLLEPIADTIKATLTAMPGKVKIEGKWYLNFGSSKDALTVMTALGLKYSKTIYTKYGKYMSEIVDENPVVTAGMQMVFVIDSITTAIPAALASTATGKEANRSLAMDAREQTTNIKPLVGMLRSKHSTIISINQMRKAIKIGFAAGPSTYDPGAEFLKFATSVRVEMSECPVPDKFTGMKIPGSTYRSTKIGEEASIVGPEVLDRYEYKRMSVTKNKFGPEHTVAKIRFWQQLNTITGEVTDMGIDPVYDAYNVLLSLKYVKELSLERGGTYMYGLENIIPGLTRITWGDFKTLILTEIENNSLVRNAILRKYLNKDFDENKEYPSIWNFAKDITWGQLKYNKNTVEQQPMLVTEANLINNNQDFMPVTETETFEDDMNTYGESEDDEIGSEEDF